MRGLSHPCSLPSPPLDYFAAKLCRVPRQLRALKFTSPPLHSTLPFAPVRILLQAHAPPSRHRFIPIPRFFFLDETVSNYLQAIYDD